MIERRGGLPMRPLPFVAGWVLVVLGFFRGLAWLWTTTRFSGNILIQILVPRDLLNLQASNWLWLGVGVAGIVLLVYSHTPSRPDPLGGAAGLPLFGSRMRFYPFVAALALFILTFASVYLFDVAVQATSAPGGFATFVYLDYANLFARPIQSTFGGLLMVLGVAILAGSVGPAPATRAFEPPPPIKPPAAAAVPATRRPSA